MGTVHVYGFRHEDLIAGRKVIESVFSICMVEAEDSGDPGYYFRWSVPDGPCVQIRSNHGTSLRWSGDPSNPWHPTFGVLVWVHGADRGAICQRLQHDVPGLSFLEERGTM